jgi:two-component system sensor histidine kinase SenX3
VIVIVAAIAGVAGVIVGILVARSRATTPDLPVAVGTTDAASMPDRSFLPALLAAVDRHPTGIVVADASGGVIHRNESAIAFRGTHTGTLLEAAVDRHLAAARNGRPSRELVEFYGPPRSAFQVIAVPLDGGGSVAFVDDVTERRRVEQVRTDFVANISHELKTPIGALSVLAETLAGETDPATLQRVVGRMMSEADRAIDTLEDLMELSRIEVGAEQSTDRVRVSDVIRGALDRASQLAAQCEVSISTLEPVANGEKRSDGIFVVGDRRQLVSAVGNLVENAVKYSDRQTSVQVRAREIDGWVEIAVADQGIGIPQRDLDRIFERFYRVDRARSRTTGGTGLGLSIVRNVASNHAGEVVVTSVEGEGSTFVLRLPSEATWASRNQSEVEPADAAARGRDHDQGVA